MPAELVGLWNYKGCTRQGWLCPNVGAVLRYTEDCHMYAELYWHWWPIPPLTQFYQGVVVPAIKPKGAVDRHCVEHVVTDASFDVMNMYTGIKAGSIQDRCPVYSAGDPPTMSILVGYDLPTWELHWVKVEEKDLPLFPDMVRSPHYQYDPSCEGCNMTVAEASEIVREYWQNKSTINV